jgi:hypothetical protein
MLVMLDSDGDDGVNTEENLLIIYVVPLEVYGTVGNDTFSFFRTLFFIKPVLSSYVPLLFFSF